MKLPLKLVMKPVLPIKNANFKITVDTNKPPVNLNDIFPGKSCDHAIPDAKVSFHSLEVDNCVLNNGSLETRDFTVALWHMRLVVDDDKLNVRFSYRFTW